MNFYEVIRAYIERTTSLYRDGESDEATSALAELERAAAEPVAYCNGDNLNIGIPLRFQAFTRQQAFASTPLYATPPPAPVAEIREVVVTDEMCGRVFAAACGTEVSDGAFRVTRKLLAAWRAELGPALGLVELKEPTPEECERICTEYERLLMREGTCGGRDAFDAVRAVMWPKEVL